MVDLAGLRDPVPHRPGGAGPQGCVLSPAGDPLRRLRDAAGDAPLPPLRIDAGGGSTRPGPIGAVVDRARGAIVRLLTPALAELLAQLERDRHRTRGEIADLRRRVAELEHAEKRDRPQG